MLGSATSQRNHSTEAPPRRRRWFPLTLKMFAAVQALLLAASVFSVWWPYRREHRTAHAIRSWGPDCYSCLSTQRGPDWLRRLAGDEFMRVFDRIYLVNLCGSAIGDGNLLDLRSLTELQFLYLSSTSVTAEGIQELQNVLPACKIYVTGDSPGFSRL
jgi:hypothetical protein